MPSWHRPGLQDMLDEINAAGENVQELDAIWSIIRNSFTDQHKPLFDMATEAATSRAKRKKKGSGRGDQIASCHSAFPISNDPASSVAMAATAPACTFETGENTGGLVGRYHKNRELLQHWLCPTLRDQGLVFATELSLPPLRTASTRRVALTKQLPLIFRIPHHSCFTGRDGTFRGVVKAFVPS